MVSSVIKEGYRDTGSFLNLKTLTITNAQFDEYFGFTDKEVKEMLAYYDLEEHYETMKEWYNGYRFGKTDVYCP